MALQGTLETFSVPEVLRLLAGTRKTGMLALDGDRGAGTVWLSEGRIVGARSAHEPEGDVEPVLFDLLRYEEGSFIFEPDAGYPGDTPADADVETALLAAETLLEEWHEIASVVPSLRVWVSMTPTIASPEVTVTADQWAALAIVGRGTSGHRLADELGLGELDGSRRIRDLVDAGLVEVDDTPVESSLVDQPSSRTDDPADDFGAEGTWTTTDDLTVGLAGFVARAADEERNERMTDLDVTAFEAPLTPTPADDVFHVEATDPETDDGTADDDFDIAVVDEADTADAPLADPVHTDTADEDETSGHHPVESFAADVTTGLDGDAGEPTADPDEAFDPPAPAAAAIEDHDADGDEFLSQLANLSPKAAAAIEATASADENPSRRLPNGDGDEEINRNLLLKFLSSAKP